MSDYLDKRGRMKDNTVSFRSTDDSGSPVEVLRISKDGIWANPDVPVNETAQRVFVALEPLILAAFANTADRDAARREE